ncbi:N-acetylmuramoyl-L-alanine amidase family protein [Qipengyuania gaetbuli]|uniref:N-acetylmuramoyl-L-alanine amidase family protein n=1 Tax=Qipengyuania gaetbuli TaxID=266952 RepID=UPI001CFD7D6B|nr:N-acetylmuramoyl-L-alanine amidase [Qipengyuania gaetbuli]
MSPLMQILAPILLTLASLAGAIGLAWQSGLAGPEPGIVLRASLPQQTVRAELPQVRGADSLPLIVIDPGHGGFDPGASASGYREKTLVLGLARALRDEIESRKIARVALTRDDDRYLLHSERFEMARRLGADLFLSIHADSAGDAGEVEGASIYTLSDRASSAAAARFAARENASDRLNGVDLGVTSDTVSDILVELSQRRTQAQSDEFARLIQRAGEGVITFHPQPRHAADLKVLRAPDIPSVLFESGYITNEEDARRLASAEGRQRFAQVMSRAIALYFARREES